MSKRILIAAAAAALVIAAFCLSAIPRSAKLSTARPIEKKPSPVIPERSTPADAAIDRAQTLVQREPNAPEGYNELASAFMQKTRETGDFGFIRRAEAAVARATQLAPDDYNALKLRAKLALSNHRFAEGLALAQSAAAQRPLDYDIYGAIIDAQVELGQYQDAIQSADRMMRIRPYAPSYARASYLRSLYGDTAGAIAVMRMAEQSAGDPEGLAWIAVHLGDELMNAGQRMEAEHEYDRALFAVPNYHFALAGKARAMVAAGKMNEAVEFYRRAEERVPLPEFAIALGNLYARLGRAQEAQQQYDLVEFIEGSGTVGTNTYSRQMALFWADRGVRLDEALALARRERASRADIFTSDALAWCLYKKGEFAEARSAIEEALRLGTRDAQMNYHAGLIYQALGDQARAAEHLQLALQINPTFDVLQAQVAQKALHALKT